MARQRVSKIDSERLNRLVGMLAGDTNSAAQTRTDQLLDNWLKSALCVHPLLLQVLRRAAADAEHDQALPPAASLGQLLFDVRTDVAALEAISHYARQLSASTGSEDENTAIFVLYWAAVASAIVHHGARISSEPYESLAESLADLSMQNWLSAPLKELFSRAAEMSRARSAEGADGALQDHTGEQSTQVDSDSIDTRPDFDWPAVSSHTSPECPGSLVGNYRLLDRRGEGGMGIVYRARQEHPIRRQVALKVIKPGMDSRRVIARFEAERQALALLDHPNIAKVLDAGTTEVGRPYFVMEYVDGLPITEHCDRHGFSIEDRLDLFLQVCHAVHHAHQKGIIHRDLKPSNILVSIQDDQTLAKIIDFGVAKAVAQPLTDRTVSTEQGRLLGTPEYMSPEQAEMANEDIDTRSDVYSLGVLLYILLAGMLPFDSEGLRVGGLDHIRKMIREDEPKTPSTRLSRLGEEATNIAKNRSTEVPALAKRLQRELEWIPLKAMRKDRAERYRSAAELADDIRNYLLGAPLIAGPPSTVYRVSKFMRRNKALAMGGAAVLAVLTAGVVVSTVFAVKTEYARAEAQAVSDFLNGSVIELFDPYKVPSGEISRRSLVDAMSEKLERDFTGPPLSEATIRHTLGHAYWSIGVYELAAQYFERALDVCRTQLGAEHPTTLAWMETLGWTYHFQSRFREEEPLFEEALAGARRVWGDGHEQTGHFMWSLASLYCVRGRYEEAEQLSERALEISRRERSAEDRHTIEVMSLMVWIYLFQGRYEEAEHVCTKALEINLRLRGPNDWWTLTLQHQMAGLHWNLGRSEDAELLLLRVLNGRRSVFGHEHADVLFTMADLGQLYATLGQYEKAESLLEDALSITGRVLGNAHWLTAYSAHGLAILRATEGRYPEAATLLNEGLTVVTHVFGREHPIALTYTNALGVLHREQEKYREAKRLLTEALEGRRIKLGPDHPHTLESAHELAVLRIANGDYEKAAPLLLDAYNGRETKLGLTHPHAIDSLRELVRLYEAWNKPEEAAKWRAKLPRTEAMEE